MKLILEHKPTRIEVESNSVSETLKNHPDYKLIIVNEHKFIGLCHICGDIVLSCDNYARGLNGEVVLIEKKKKL